MFIKFLLFYAINYGLFLIFAMIGEHLANRIGSSSNIVHKYLFAIIDNLIHSMHSFLSWQILIGLKLFDQRFSTFLVTQQNRLRIIKDLLLTALMASMIDLDHFIEAKSFSILAVQKLRNRPFMHNILLMASLSFVLICLPAKLTNDNDTNDRSSTKYHNKINDRQSHSTDLNRIGWLLLNASFTHLTRDSLRRGFCLRPIIETSRLPKSVYYVQFALFPKLIDSLTNYFAIDFDYSQKIDSDHFDFDEKTIV
ncbi:hypothetical protein NH340_JMT08247 [Sarcoptes scabiei]|nr:hypothetical protein NH340_JMT08247 [Sarcoptes scabiei]